MEHESEIPLSGRKYLQGDLGQKLQSSKINHSRRRANKEPIYRPERPTAVTVVAILQLLHGLIAVVVGVIFYLFSSSLAVSLREDPNLAKVSAELNKLAYKKQAVTTAVITSVNIMTFVFIGIGGGLVALSFGLFAQS
jgi:hypothetical protein